MHLYKIQKAKDDSGRESKSLVEEGLRGEICGQGELQNDTKHGDIRYAHYFNCTGFFRYNI